MEIAVIPFQGVEGHYRALQKIVQRGITLRIAKGPVEEFAYVYGNGVFHHAAPEGVERVFRRVVPQLRNGVLRPGTYLCLEDAQGVEESCGAGPFFLSHTPDDKTLPPLFTGKSVQDDG